MRWVNSVVLTYGLLLIVLGLYGYFAPILGLNKETPSIISLIAGGVSGLLVLGTLVLHKTRPREARIAAAVIALLMLGKMVPDAIAKHQWHTITISIASFLTFACLLYGHFATMSARKSQNTPLAR